MKKAIAVILLIVAMFSLSACSGNPEPAYTDNYSDNDMSNNEAVPEVREGAYYISPDISVRAPDGYMVFDKDCTFSAEDCDQIGVNYSDMLTYMNVQSSTLIMTPENCLWADKPFQINVKYKDRDYENITLSELDNASIDILASAIISGFDITSDGYQLYETDNALFIVFDCKILDNEQRYATIIDGHMIYIYGSAANGLTEEQRDLIREVADSLEV